MKTGIVCVLCVLVNFLVHVNPQTTQSGDAIDLGVETAGPEEPGKLYIV